MKKLQETLARSVIIIIIIITIILISVFILGKKIYLKCWNISILQNY